MSDLLPAELRAWFAQRGWVPRPFQLAVLSAAGTGRACLVLAPTGGGKTLAGFLPVLAVAADHSLDGLVALYVSPLKALAADIARNLQTLISELGLPLSLATRTGDTSRRDRAAQRQALPNILLTTPESLSLLLSHDAASNQFAKLRHIIIDEVHALAGTKRGDQLALCLARLATLAPGAVRIGLSATAAHIPALRAFVAPDARPGSAELITETGGAIPQLSLMLPAGRLPWGGHMGLGAAPEILARITAARLTLVFVNTRAQAELMFQALWHLNEANLPIAIHHGSLEPALRQRVEAAMAEGRLRAVVATASLDLGLDWGDVDQVIQVGAPKGVSRLLQRVGRANHRLDQPSRAILVPANRFEVLECEAAIEGIAAGDLDGDPPRPGGLDVLAQHLLTLACAGPFDPDQVFSEIRTAAPYADLSRRDFDDVLDFVATGGYALAGYERYRKLFLDSKGRVFVRDAGVIRQHRMNIGTIVEAPLLRVRLGRGRGGGLILGEIEEYFANMLRPGDTFLFAGRLLRFRALRENWVEAEDGGTGDPKIPAYAGGRLPLSTYLATRVRALLHDPAAWSALPEPVRDWLSQQSSRSVLPGPDNLLIELFPRGDRHYLVAYPFEGRNAHQTLGMLLTRRMERLGQKPLGFVATDYVLGIWSAEPADDFATLFDQDMLGDDLEAWMADSSLLRRTFRQVAVIAGLVQRDLPGQRRNARQVSINTDLIYDVLRRYQPDHVLLRATRADAAAGLTDLGRLAAMLARVQGRLTVVRLDWISPLAVPVLLEIGRERVRTAASEDALLAEAEALAAEARAQ